MITRNPMRLLLAVRLRYLYRFGRAETKTQSLRYIHGELNFKGEVGETRAEDVVQ